jgi:hypothetical protein
MHGFSQRKAEIDIDGVLNQYSGAEGITQPRD